MSHACMECGHIHRDTDPVLKEPEHVADQLMNSVCCHCPACTVHFGNNHMQGCLTGRFNNLEKVVIFLKNEMYRERPLPARRRWWQPGRS